MLYVLTDDYQIDIYTDEGALFKHLSLCPCDTCDTECKECNPSNDCPHDDDGHTGGMCVSAPIEGEDGNLHWRRLHYYTTYKSMVDCSCPQECSHLAPLVEQAQKHAPGERPRGERKKAFLRTRPELSHGRGARTHHHTS